MNKEIEIPEGYEVRIEGNKIILEPKESEDEGIIRFVIDCISELQKANTENAEFNARCGEAIAYLEKQKEPKDVSASTMAPGCWQGEEMPAECNGDKYPKDIEADAVQFCFDNGINLTPLQAKKIATYYLMIGHNNGYVEGRKNAHIPARELGLPSSLDFQQQPTEIDERKIINKHITEDSLSSDVNSRLKECGWYVTDEKSAEWSEEDEERIKSIKATLEQFAYSNGMLDVNGDYCDASIIKNMNWLNALPERFNLQPHWKPSKEQMETLKNCAYGVFQNGDGPALRELYNDLEKLYYEQIH